MRTAAVAFIVAMLCGTILTPIVRLLAHRYGALDHALSSRKIHGRPVPRLGGIAIVIAFYVPLFGLLLLHSDVGRMFLAERNHVIGLFAGGLAIALLGLYDDLRGAGATRKFAVQFGVAGLLYYLGFRVELLANPFGNPIHLHWLSLPFTVLWMVGVINAMNLIDGLDGLAGGVALVAVVTTFLVSLQRGHPLMMLFSSALAGAIVGFLFYNFNPASIFMGDTGSMFLGFVLSATALQTSQKASTAVAVLIPAMALGVPIADTLLAIGRRAIRGRPLFQADKEHIHHRLLASGLTHRQAVLVLYGSCVFLGGSALVLTYSSSLQSALLLIVVALVGFFFLRSLGFMRFAAVSAAADDRRRNRAMRAAIRPLGQRLRAVHSLNDVWPIVIEASGVFGAVAVSLRLNGLGSPDAPVSFDHGVDQLSSLGSPVKAQFSIPGGKPMDRLLELSWIDDRKEVDRDTEIAVDIFCEYLADVVDAVAARISLADKSASAPARSRA
jgi:UDP-GlcNAc:undecaprenyl-phosphate GlcNAc-1-phosphate transferase